MPTQDHGRIYSRIWYMLYGKMVDDMWYMYINIRILQIPVLKQRLLSSNVPVDEALS